MLAAGIADLARLGAPKAGRGPTCWPAHSLGEYSALVAAGALDFKADGRAGALSRRGDAARRAAGTGAMAAILGLDDAVIEAACLEAAEGSVVQPVNYNSPGQLVIAGEAKAVGRAIEACKARGAKRAVLLPVSVPSHSALMKPAAEELRERLRALEIRSPAIRCAHSTQAFTPTRRRSGTGSIASCSIPCGGRLSWPR